MLEIETKELRRCDLVKINGRVDSASAPELKKALDAITEAGRFKIVLNLAGVDFLSSAGLRQLLDALKTCKRWNRGNLILSETPVAVKDVLTLSGLAALFTLVDTDVEAVGNF